MENTQIIILAAGKGTRMGGNIPKALTPLGNQSMIEHVMDTIESLETFSKPPIVVVGYKAEMIQEVLGDRAIYAIQNEQLGTGHAVMSADSLIKDSTKRVLILYADQPFVSRETIEKLITNKEDALGPLSIATAVIEDDDLFSNQFYNFGRIIRDQDGNITKIVEKKDASDEEVLIQEVNPAYFCCDKDWMIQSLQSLKNDNTQGEYYLTDLVKICFDQQHQIESIQINEKEALGANTKEQLAVLEKYQSQ
ncbi:MAG: NTP transferase domain-containing protein [Candidatus Pacebacteria bacterium]|nr:NTP transferase domain-containing protein [Candidatus Paceibacterota bacterium]